MLAVRRLRFTRNGDRSLRLTLSILGKTLVLACADVCENLVSVHDVEMKNQCHLSDTYRERVVLMTSSELHAARKKLGLTATRFSKELELEEKAITRYENKAIQTPKIDEFIRAFISR